MNHRFFPDERHKVDRVFAFDPKLQRVISDHFSSMVPLLLMNHLALQGLTGIRAPRSRHIVSRLQKLGYEPARSNETLLQSIERQYGSIEDAPLMALSVVFRTIGRSRCITQLEPLLVVTHMAERHPRMTVGDLTGYSRRHLREELSELDLGCTPAELDEHIDALDLRLIEYGLKFTPELRPVIVRLPQ